MPWAVEAIGLSARIVWVLTHPLCDFLRIREFWHTLLCRHWAFSPLLFQFRTPFTPIVRRSYIKINMNTYLYVHIYLYIWTAICRRVCKDNSELFNIMRQSSKIQFKSFIAPVPIQFSLTGTGVSIMWYWSFSWLKLQCTIICTVVLFISYICEDTFKNDNLQTFVIIYLIYKIKLLFLWKTLI